MGFSGQRCHFIVNLSWNKNQLNEIRFKGVKFSQKAQPFRTLAAAHPGCFQPGPMRGNAACLHFLLPGISILHIR